MKRRLRLDPLLAVLACAMGFMGFITAAAVFLTGFAIIATMRRLAPPSVNVTYSREPEILSDDEIERRLTERTREDR